MDYLDFTAKRVGLGYKIAERIGNEALANTIDELLIDASFRWYK